MIRVGFAPRLSWRGGINYYRNLFEAIGSLEDRQIEPVLIAGTDVDTSVLNELGTIETVRTELVDRRSVVSLVRTASQFGFHRDDLMERFVVKHGIELLSHSDVIGGNASIPCVPWIPDFQHRNLPHLFTRSQLFYRSRTLQLQSRFATRVIVSSRDAQKDLEIHAPSLAPRSRVLQFVVKPEFQPIATAGDQILETYAIAEPYFHLPNQFWVHKNHRLVIEALVELRRRGRTPLVVATGPTDDYRHPEFFRELMATAAAHDIEDRFRVLGVIPYQDVVALMLQSVAVINPSRAEGWSSSVEEAKSLGKRVIASDIPVHLEQNPSESLYIGVDDAGSLATAMETMLQSYNTQTERLRMQRASTNLPGRIQAFAQRYQEIVLEAVEGFGTR